MRLKPSRFTAKAALSGCSSAWLTELLQMKSPVLVKSGWELVKPNCSRPAR